MADSQGEGNGEATRGAQYSGPVAHEPEPVHDHHDDPAYITRTRFLTGVALVTGGVMTAAILVPVVGFAAADPLKEEEWQWVDIGPMSDFPDGKDVVDRRLRPVARVGPARVRAPQGGHDHRDLEPVRPPRVPGRLLRGRRRLRLPLSRRRLRLAGPGHLRPAAAAAGPLRRQDRDADGKDVAAAGGPGRRLPDGQGASADDRLLLGRPFSIDADQQPYELKVPGEPVTGVLANLYPF